MANSITVSYQGTRSDVNRIKALAVLKNMTMGELIADAVEKVYGTELRAVANSFFAQSVRQNKQSVAQTNNRS